MLITHAAALGSLFTGLLLRDNLVMTGVASLSGRLGRVNGLTAKLMGAAGSPRDEGDGDGGKKLPMGVIIPGRNVRQRSVAEYRSRWLGFDNETLDLIILPKATRERISVYSADTVWDLLDLALLPQRDPGR